MRYLLKKLYKMGLLLLIVALMSFAGGNASYSDLEEAHEGLENGSRIMSPGYINYEKQKTKEIMEQTPQKKGFLEQAVEYIKNKLGNRLAEHTTDKVTPDLKKKESKLGDEGTGLASLFDLALGTPLIDPETAERMLNEAVEKGASVTTLTNGSVVEIWREDANTYFSIRDNRGDLLLNKQQIALDGDWGMSWVSDIIDVGSGKFAAVVRGFTYDSNSDSYESNSIYSIRIYDTGTSSLGTLASQKDYKTYYSCNYSTGYYNYEGTYIGNLTSLGNGSYVMSVSKYLNRRDSTGSSYNSDSYISLTDHTLNVDTGIKYRLNSYSTGNWQDGTYEYNQQYVRNIVSLGGGSFALAISEYGYDQANEASNSGTYLRVLDSNFNTRSNEYYANEYTYSPGEYYNSRYKYVTNMASLGDGKFAVGWSSYNYSYDYTTNRYVSDSAITITRFDDMVNELNSYEIGDAWSWSADDTGWHYSYNYIGEMKTLDDGTLVVALNSGGGNYNYDTGSYDFKTDASLKLIRSNGESVNIELGGSLGDDASRTISKITSLGGGTFAVVLSETSGSESATSVQQFSARGETQNVAGSNSSELYTNTTREAKITQAGSGSNGGVKTNALSSKDTDKSTLAATLNSDRTLASKTLSDKNGALKIDAQTQDILLSALGKAANENDPLSVYALLLGEMDVKDAMAILASIMQNPTAEQKEMLEAVTALLSNLKKAEEEAEDPEALAKATEEFAQIAAVALIAQALPDLFKEGDMAGVKGLFSELNGLMGDVVLKYEMSIEAYYNELKKDIASNLTILQLKNVLSKEMTEEELDKLPRNQLDAILKKINMIKEKGHVEEYIVKQEAAYREKYIEPSKKLMEENVKHILKDFSHQIYSILDTAKKD